MTESMMVMRTEQFTRILEEYMKDNCRASGEQESNLSEAQQLGLKSLLKRLKSGEIVVMQTDKSGKFALVTPEIYKQTGAVHTAKDREIGMIEIEAIQSKMNGHVSMWLKMFRVGENWNHGDRRV